MKGEDQRDPGTKVCGIGTAGEGHRGGGRSTWSLVVNGRKELQGSLKGAAAGTWPTSELTAVLIESTVWQCPLFVPSKHPALPQSVNMQDGRAPRYASAFSFGSQLTFNHLRIKNRAPAAIQVFFSSIVHVQPLTRNVCRSQPNSSSERYDCFRNIPLLLMSCTRLKSAKKPRSAHQNNG